MDRWLAAKELGFSVLKIFGIFALSGLEAGSLELTSLTCCSLNYYRRSEPSGTALKKGPSSTATVTCSGGDAQPTGEHPHTRARICCPTYSTPPGHDHQRSQWLIIARQPYRPLIANLCPPGTPVYNSTRPTLPLLLPNSSSSSNSNGFTTLLQPLLLLCRATTARKSTNIALARPRPPSYPTPCTRCAK